VALWSEWVNSATYTSKLHVYKGIVSIFAKDFEFEVFTNLTISQDGSRMVTVENTYHSANISGSKVTTYMLANGSYIAIPGTVVLTTDITGTTSVALSDDGQWLFVGTSSKCYVYDQKAFLMKSLENLGDEYTIESLYEWDFTVKSLACKNSTLVIGTGNGYAVKLYDNEIWLDHDVGSTDSGTGDYVALADDGVKLIYSLPGTTGSTPYGTVTLNLSSSSNNWVIILVSILAVVVISGIIGFFFYMNHLSYTNL
jgi:hypothetical protein